MENGGPRSITVSIELSSRNSSRLVDNSFEKYRIHLVNWTSKKSWHLGSKFQSMKHRETVGITILFGSQEPCSFISFLKKISHLVSFVKCIKSYKSFIFLNNDIIKLLDMTRLNRSSIPLMLLSGITAPRLSPQWQLLTPSSNINKSSCPPSSCPCPPLLYVQSFVRTYFTKWQAAVSKLCTLSAAASRGHLGQSNWYEYKSIASRCSKPCTPCLYSLPCKCNR